MPMSEHERNVLAELEHEFRPSNPALSRWSNLTMSKRLALAAIAFPAGVLLMLIALIANSAGGIMLALVAYALIFASVATLVDCTLHTRAAIVRRAQSGTVSQPRRYFP